VWVSYILKISHFYHCNENKSIISHISNAKYEALFGRVGQIERRSLEITHTHIYMFSMWFAYIHCEATYVGSMGPPRDYINSPVVLRRGRVPPP
jgi:hypothetical protein